MSREVICPTCGMRLPLDDSKEIPRDDQALAEVHTVETVIPRTVISDELHFPAPSGSDECPLGPLPAAEPPSEAPVLPPDLGWSMDSDAPGARQPVGSGSTAEIPSPWVAGGAGVALVDPPETRARPMASSVLGQPGPQRDPGRSWPMLVLGSYASAVTIACLWLLFVRPDGGAPPVASDAEVPNSPGAGRHDHGLRTAHNGQVEPVEPVPEGQTAEFGESLRVGALELTPLEWYSGPVTLTHPGLDGVPQTRDGGPDALWLKLRLRNLSTDQVFAPLDEAFVREKDRGLPDSFLEAPDGSRIYSYPLPIASEWGIEGQEFRTLRPGESFETFLVSDKDAFGRKAPEMTWRLKVRTGAGPDATAIVGVRLAGTPPP